MGVAGNVRSERDAHPVKQGQAMMRYATALTRAKASAGSGPQTSQTVEESMDQFHGILDVFGLF